MRMRALCTSSDANLEGIRVIFEMKKDGWVTDLQTKLFAFKTGVFSIQIDRVVVSFSELRTFLTADLLKMPNFQVV